MKVDFAARELTIKLVYYGPALSGKTTNLRAIHWLATSKSFGASKTCGQLMTLETQNDRTLFFDMLPVTVNSETGLKVRVKLFTVPGQVMHDATRRLVLQGADGVAFIADSRISENESNRVSFLNLQQNLRDAGLDPAKLPIVIQFNKRDLDDIRSDEELEALAERSKEPIYKAVATRGFGVMHTFRGLVRRTWENLERRHGLEEKFAIAPLQFLSEIEAQLRHDPMVR